MLNKLFMTQAYKSKDFETHINKVNIDKSKIFVLLIIILEVLMFSLTYVYPRFFHPDYIFSYRKHYLILGLYAIFFFLVTQLLLKSILKESQFFKVIIFITTLLGLIWGASIAVMDLQLSGTMSVYLTFIFMISIVLITRPDYAFVQFLVAQIYFVSQLPSSNRMIELTVNSTVFLMFAWFVSRQQYEKAYLAYTQNKLLEEKNGILAKQNIDLARLTVKDHLTGMYNRYSLDDILSKKWLEAYVHKSPIHVMMIDIDYFKQFNDTYGHINGDTCLIKVGEVLISVADAFGGYAFRYGGDEFCLIFSDLESTESVVELVHSKISQMDIAVNNKIIPVTLSIGVFSEIPKKSDGEWACIDYADQNLYSIKIKRKRRSDD